MLDRLAEICSGVLRVRDETVQERADTVDALYRQILKYDTYDERLDRAFQAYRWLKRAPERGVIELFGRPLSIRLPSSRELK